MSKSIQINNITIKADGLSLCSSEVKQGDTFLACKSFGDVNSHGIAYAGDAINHGATAILWEPTEQLTQMPTHVVQMIDENGQQKQISVPLYRINNLSQHVSQIASEYYDHPSKNLNIIGITGTNGKTSVSYFIAQALNQIDRHQCAVIGTLGNGLLNEVTESTHTTPDPIKVQSLISQFKNQHATDVIMEVSSHALAQNRVKAVDFNIAVFTNLSRDHLDYHGDMENYKKAKLSLFDFDSLDAVVINADDEVGKEFIQHCMDKTQIKPLKVISYSTSIVDDTLKGQTHLQAEQISFSENGISCTINDHQITIPLIGHFNLSNVLACLGTLNAMDVSLENALKSIERLTPVIGRMQMLKSNSPKQALAIIDFAHTPDALEKALIAAKTHCQGQLWCVFGCGGDRDKGKRPLMGQIAEKYSDKVIITSDNPRTEEPLNIIEDIKQGFNTKNYAVEVDRKLAIQMAINESTSDDIILIAGKGHENYQEIMGIKHPYSDIEYTQEMLAA